MRSFTSSAVLILLVMIIVNCGSFPLSAEPEVDPLRYSKAINNFVRADSVAMPAPNSLLFVGSSSIVGWKTLAADLPEVNVINRGFGGSHMADLIYYMDQIVFPYNPNAIVVYEGDNDIASGLSPKAFYKNYLTFIQRTLENWPEIPIFFISIKPSLDRVDHMENMAKANALVKAYTLEHENLFYIDVFNPMLNENGTPREDIFGHDGLHMNATGYELWTEIVRAELGVD